MEEALDEALRNLKTSAEQTTENLPPNQANESPILRKKERSTEKLTDDQVFEELRRICHPGDPYRRFERSKELGAG